MAEGAAGGGDSSATEAAGSRDSTMEAADPQTRRGRTLPFRVNLPTVRPPGKIFHSVLFALLILWMGAVSVPGSIFFVLLATMLFLAVMGLVWLSLALGVLWTGVKDRSIGKAPWLLVAPIAVLLTWGLIRLDAPFQARWALARPAFDRVVDGLEHVEPGDDDWHVLDAPGRISTYRISKVIRVGDALIFYERNGAFLNDAGFAYLPDGPSPDLRSSTFEAPEFRHLGGPWYAWTAGW